MDVVHRYTDAGMPKNYVIVVRKPRPKQPEDQSEEQSDDQSEADATPAATSAARAG